MDSAIMENEKMDDLISRQAAIKAFKNFLTIHDSRGVEYLCSAVTMDGVNKILSDLPSADAEPVRHGHWLRTGRTNVYGGFEVECSVCNDNVMITNSEYEHYCRNCGARMDERSE